MITNTKKALFLLLTISFFFSLYVAPASAETSSAWYPMTPTSAQTTAYNEIGGTTVIATCDGIKCNLYTSTDGITSTKNASLALTTFTASNYSVSNNNYITNIFQLGTYYCLTMNDGSFLYATSLTGTWTKNTKIVISRNPSFRDSISTVLWNGKMWYIDDCYKVYNISTATATAGTVSFSSAVRALFVGNDNNLYLIDDSGNRYMYNGTSWVLQAGTNIQGSYCRFQTGNETGKLYAYDRLTGDVMVSSDNGANWAVSGHLPEAGRIVEFNGALFITQAINGNAVQNQQKLYKNYVLYSSIKNQLTNNILKVSNKLILCGDTCIEQSTDGINFTRKNFGIAENVPVYQFYYDGSYIYAAARSLVYRSADNGNTWEEVNIDGPLPRRFINITQVGSTFYASAELGTDYGYLIYKSTDGLNFTLDSTISTTNSPVYNGLKYFKGSIVSMLVGGGVNGLAATTGPIYGYDCNANYLYYVIGSNVYRVSDPSDTSPVLVTTCPYGISFGSYSGIGDYASTIAVMDDDTFYVIGLDKNVYYYNGATWSKVSTLPSNITNTYGLQKVDSNTVLYTEITVGSATRTNYIYMLNHATKAETNISYDFNTVTGLKYLTIYSFYKNQANGAIFAGTQIGSYDPDPSSVIPKKPIINVDKAPGAYSAINLNVNFTANVDGCNPFATKWYYTTDGSAPDTANGTYTTTDKLSVPLNNGVNHINVIAVDENGIKSDMATFNYEFTKLTKNGFNANTPVFPVDVTSIVYSVTNYDNSASEIYKFDTVNNTTYRLTNTGDMKTDFMAYGNYATWKSNGNIYLLNIKTNEIKQLTSVNQDSAPWTDGVNVVWKNNYNSETVKFVLYNIENGTSKEVYNSVYYPGRPKVNGDWVYWKENKAMGQKIYGYSISGNSVSTLWENPDKYSLSSYGVFVENGYVYCLFSDPAIGYEQIGKIDIATQTLSRITSAPVKLDYWVYNDSVVYSTSGSNEVFYKDGIRTIPLVKSGTNPIIYKDMVTYNFTDPDTMQNLSWYVTVPTAIPPVAPENPPVTPGTPTNDPENPPVTPGTPPVTHTSGGSSNDVISKGNEVDKNTESKIMIKELTPKFRAPEVENYISDVSEDYWGREAVAYTVKYGIMKGNGSTFEPEQKITRAEFITSIMNFLNYNSNNSSTVNFSDTTVIPSWAVDSITKAKELGLITGYADGSIKPNSEITRAEAAVIIDKVITLLDLNLTKESDVKTNDEIPSWANENASNLLSYNLVSGYPDGNFYPNKNISRAEVATILMNLLKS